VEWARLRACGLAVEEEIEEFKADRVTLDV